MRNSLMVFSVLTTFAFSFLPSSARATADSNLAVTSFISAFEKAVRVDDKIIASKNCYIEVHDLKATSLYIVVLAPWKEVGFSINTNYSPGEVRTQFSADGMSASTYYPTDCESQGCAGPLTLRSSLEISGHKLVVMRKDPDQTIECELE